MLYEIEFKGEQLEVCAIVDIEIESGKQYVEDCEIISRNGTPTIRYESRLYFRSLYPLEWAAFCRAIIDAHNQR